MKNEDWMPCKVSNPKKNGEYIVTIKNLTGYRVLKKKVITAEFYGGDWIFDGWEDNEVIAWMCMPKEYRE